MIWAENSLAGEDYENVHFQGAAYEARLSLPAMSLAKCGSPSASSLRPEFLIVIRSPHSRED